MEAEAMVAAIIDGDADGQLDALADAIRNRRRALAARANSTLAPGDRIVFNGRAVPKYLRGIGGKVATRAPLAITVDQHPQARRYAGKTVEVPLDIIDRVRASVA